MRAGRGLGNGALVGLGAGVITALAIALLFAVGLFFDESLSAALAGAALVSVFGSVIGGTIGGAAGAVLGLAFGATGSERLARWVTPALLILAFAALSADDFGPTIGFADGLTILATVGALGALGFTAGTVFEKLTTDRGHRPTNTPPLAANRFQEVR